MSIAGRSYDDPGDRLSGRFDPPRRCTVLAQWGPGGGPRNVLVRYGDGTRAVIPFSRRLRRTASLDGYPCCACCGNARPGCDPFARRHGEPCPHGCNDAATAAGTEN